MLPKNNIKNSAYNDVNLFGQNTNTVKEAQKLVVAGRKPGVEANTEKTVSSCVNQNTGQKHDLIVHKSFVNV
jgi:hypothetical protein